MSLSATTKLEAVNIMLSTIGENPVNSLTSGLVDAELAETILGSVSKAVQSEGWNFNTEKKVSFSADSSGHIILPANILRADATVEADALDLVQRGLKMYDKKNHTYNINKAVNLDTIIELEFEILPEVARRYITLKAARIFQDQLSMFVNFEDPKETPKPVTSTEPEFNKNLLKRVEELELSVRSMNCLKNDNIIYIGDLVQKSEGEMLRTPNFGRKSLNEIKEVLNTMSLYLGMEIPNWPPDNIAELSKKLEEAI